MQRNRGFTLIEVMVSLLIIAVLTSIAIPSTMKFMCSAKQAEARSMLGGLMLAQRTYKNDHGTYLYLADMEAQGIYKPKDLGLMPGWKGKYYQFETAPGMVTASDLRIAAMDTVVKIGVSGAPADWWNISQDTPPTVVTDACAYEPGSSASSTSGGSSGSPY